MFGFRQFILQSLLYLLVGFRFFAMSIPFKILKHKFILGDGNIPFEILPVL